VQLLGANVVRRRCGLVSSEVGLLDPNLRIQFRAVLSRGERER
jgi:hypothetical protein